MERRNFYPLSILLILTTFLAQFGFSQNYCASKSNAPWEYWVSNVKLGTINNTSDKFKDFNTLGYSDYTNLTTALSKGQSYPLSISPGLSWTGNVPNVYARAWIDFNNNKTFEANELVLEKTNANPLTTNVLVPTTAVTGNVRMRVSVKFGSYSTACETFEKGEVEDYTVNITTENSNCPNIKFSLPSAFGDRTEYVPSNQTCITVYWGMPRIIDSCVGLASERAILHSSVSNNTVIYSADFLSWACFPIGTTTISYNYGGNIYSFKVTVIQQSNDSPDLTLANLTIPTPSVLQGQILNYKVDIKNIGTAATTGNFNVKAYISTDNALSSNDIQDGIIPTANFGAGFSSLQVAGATTIPATLAAGQYYLILKVDADNQITESNENNNVIVSVTPFTVTSNSIGNCISKFDMTIAQATNCTISKRTTLPNENNGSITLYDNANPSKGFSIFLYDIQNRGQQISVQTGRGSTTPTAGKNYSNCVKNWIYYVGEGYVSNENRESENVVTNYAVRAAFMGNATNPDSVIVEISSSNNSFLNTYFISVNKELNCQTQCINDVTPPVFTCPTAPVTITSDVGLKYNTLILMGLAGISVSDNACGVVNTYYNFQFVGPNNAYPINLISYDGAGNRGTCNFTLNVVPSTTTGNYCASKGTLPWEYWVGNVKFNTLNNVSDKFKDFATLGYSDYTNLNTTVNKGQSYPLSISPSLSWIGNVPNAYARAWIDFNNNKTFEANELVLEKTNANPLISNVLIPTTAVTGNVRMRVSVKFGSYPTACETFDKGEVEDYTVNISGTTVDPCLTDVTPPVFTNCPTVPIRLTINASVEPLLSINNPLVTDNCGTPTLTAVSAKGNLQFVYETVSVYRAVAGTTDTITYTATDAKGNKATCKVIYIIERSGSNADLALSITSTPSVFQKYTTQIFKIKAQNVGSQALTNIKIEFKRPAQTSNGGAKVASVGTFSDFCPGGIECSEWTIPTLAAGATATLDAPVFILDPATAIVATTKLLTSTPVDGNAANNSASVTLTPATPAPAIQSLSRQKPTQYLPIIIQSIAPNPTEGDVVIEVESLKEQMVQFEFSNTMGQIIRTEKRPLEKGTNQVKFDVYEFSDGVYLIQTDVNRGRISPTKFVKF
jgi:hypothetical protein